MDNKKQVITGLAGILIGLFLAGGSARYAVNNNQTGMMEMYGINTSNVGQKEMIMDMPASSTSMDSMVSSLKNKTGNEFDKLFISEMIMHHQGAIDMANLALKNAKHDEVKTLANGIIGAQTSEIGEMKNWQQQWGYTNTASTDSGMMMKNGL